MERRQWRPSRRLNLPTDSTLSLDWTAHTSVAVTGSDDGTVRIWDTGTAEQLRALSGHTSPARAVSISPEGSFVTIGRDDGSVWVWDHHREAELYTLPGHTGPVRAVGWSPDGSQVVSGGDDKSVRSSAGVLRNCLGRSIW